MAAPAAVLNILVGANTAPANAALMKTQAQLQRTAATGTATGATLKKAFLGVGVAAGAAAVGLFKVGEAFDDSFDTISVKTGATGKDLRKLKQSFRDVVSDVPADFATVSKAIGALNQRLEITGKPLERLTKQMVELSRITETDVEENIQGVTRAFGDWEVKTKDQTEQLDKFFRASQESGASVADLAEQVVQFGAPLRQVGFTLDEATAMFAQFEEAGVNTQTMMPGLKFALRSFMEAGKDPQQALATTFQQITDGTMDAKEAFEVFGGRATPDMIEAIQQGRFELDKFTETIAKGDATIRESAKRTGDFTEQWQKFKNNALLALEPVARRVFRTVADEMERVTDIMSDKNLSKEGKMDALADLVQEWMVRAIEKMGETAPKLAEAFVKGFVQAPVLGQLLLGGWLFSKMGGVGAAGGLGTRMGGRFGKMFGIAAAASAGYAFARDFQDEISGAAADIFGGSKEENSNLLESLTGIDLGGPIRDALNLEDENTPLANWEKALDIKGLGKWSQHARETNEKLNKDVPIIYRRGGEAAHEETKRTREKIDDTTLGQARDVGANAENMVSRVSHGLKRLQDNTNSALKAYGVKVLNYKLDLNESSSGGAFHGFRRGGPINTGASSGDSVPAMLERGEYVLNRNATKAVGKDRLDALNFGAASRFQAGGVAGLQPGISRLASWAADRYGLRISSGFRSGTGSLHNIGAAVDLIPPGMTATKGIFGAFKSQLAELFYDPWGGYNDGQMIGPIGDHMDHIHAAILGAGGAPSGGAASLKRMLLKGPGGPLKSMGQGALDKAYKAAKGYLAKNAMTSHGNIGDTSGPLQAVARRMVESIWGAGQWPFFNDLVQRESGWNPTAVNPSSGAAGLAQALPPSKYPAGAWPYTGQSSAVKQLEWMVDYISGRYGNPAGAIAWHDAHNWYQKGGEVMPSLDRGGRVTQSGLAQVHPGDVHMGKSSPNINVYVDPVSLDVRVESIVEGMAPEIAEFTARQLGRGQGRSRQLSRG